MKGTALILENDFTAVPPTMFNKELDVPKKSSSLAAETQVFFGNISAQEPLPLGSFSISPISFRLHLVSFMIAFHLSNEVFAKTSREKFEAISKRIEVKGS